MIKQYLILIIGALSLYSCNQEREINSIEDLQKILKPKTERFVINPNQDNFIEGEKGTVLYFPSNSLVYDDGSPVTTEVQLQLNEFYSVSDIISENLSTLSDSLLLETGGMINISATSEGKKLKLDPSKSYVVCFPKREKKNMELFYGENNSDNINWKVESIANYVDTNSYGFNYLKSDTSLITEYLGVSGWSSSSFGPKGRDCSFGWQIKHSDSTVFRYIKKLYEDSTKLENQMKSSDSHVRMHFEIGEDGIVKSLSHDSITAFNSRVEKVIMSLPPFDMNKMYCAPEYEYWLSVGVTDHIDRDQYLEKFNEKYTNYRNKAVEHINAKELDYYILSATKLDWINCDRFINTESKKDDLFVSVKNPEKTKVILVFKDFNSILNGTPKDGGFVFNQIPIDEAITVLAISHAEGKCRMAKYTTNSSKGKLELNNFQTFTLEQLTDELNNIN